MPSQRVHVAGWNAAEFAAFGVPHDHRVSRFAEAFEIVRRPAGKRARHPGRALLAGRRRRPAPAPTGAPPFDGGQQRPAHAELELAPRRRLEHLVRRLRQQRRVIRPSMGSSPPRPGTSVANLRRSRAVRARSSSWTARPANGRSPRTPRRWRARPSSSPNGSGTRRRGADEVILVVSPITERSIRRLADVVAAV